MTPTTKPERRRDTGSATAFIVIMTIALIVVAGLVLDGGLALSAKATAMDVAQAAARDGADQLNLTEYRNGADPLIDPAAAERAAETWIREAGYSGTASADSDSITVTVHTTQSTQLLSIVGVNQLRLSASATADIAHGVTEEGS